MSDVLTPKQRSHCMSKIKGKNTKPEIILRQALWQAGCRYRLNSQLPGKPDLVFPGAKVVVFVDGCFWHSCADHLVLPKKNADFWRTKLKRNKERDIEVNSILSEMGWKVIRIWEHAIKKDATNAAQTVIKALK